MTHELPFTEKYRPLFLSEILGNEAVISALDSLTHIPNMLFYGPPGTGKTTAIRALCRKIYSTKDTNLRIANVIELNASDERGIQTIREIVKKFASTALDGKLKLVILDESDSMSKDAQNALRRIIEDFSNNCRFCLIANYSNKIIPAIQSRCCKFRFGPVFSTTTTTQRVVDICKKENITFEKEGIETLISISNGDARKLFNDIEGVYKTFTTITKENVFKLSNTVDKKVYELLFYDIIHSTFDEGVKKIRDCMNENGLECTMLINSLSELIKESDLKYKMNILKEFADIEKRVLICNGQKIQSMAIIATMIKFRN